MKKIILAILFILAIGTTYALTIEYTKQTTVQHEVEIGGTVMTVDGLTVTLINAEQGNLTYYALEETSTDKHTLTYTYNYTIHNGTYDVVVSSLSDDIVIVSYNVADMITVEIALNQDIDFNIGDTIDFILLFELVDITPININTATYEELIQLGFSDSEATDISGFNTDVYSLDELNYYVYLVDKELRFGKLIEDGVIVFN